MASANDFIAENVMHGMFLGLDRSMRTRVPFTSDQLNLLFKSPLFLKCAGDKREHQNGSISVRDWRYWIPLVGLCVPKTLSALISRRNHLTSVDHVRTVLLRPGRLGLAIQVEEPT
jgi:hypothetical protein